MTMWFLDPASLKRPVYLSLADQIGRAIFEGKLAKGARLPPHRKLAHTLGVSVQTVSRSYEELIRRGLLSGETGRGTFVRPQGIGHGADARAPYLPERLGEVVDLSILKPVCGEIHLSHMRKALTDLAESLPESSVLSFRPNVIFPRHRAVAAEWLKRFGLAVPSSNIVLTNGATSGLAAALLAVAKPGSTIAAEAICSHTLIPLAAYLGLTLIGLEVDDEGIVPDALEAACREQALRTLVIQPNVINPMASLMNLARREALVSIARRHDLTILEDDILGPLVENRPAPIAALAPERTIHITTFTKIVMPGLRTGYLAIPDRFLAAVTNRHLVTNWVATPLIAEVATRWIEDGTAERLVEWQRKALRSRNAVAAEQLAGVAYRAHPNGLHVWLSLDDQSESAFIAEARLRGVAIAPGASFQPGPNGKPAIRMALGSTDEADLRRGLAVVAALARSGPEPLLMAI